MENFIQEWYPEYFILCIFLPLSLFGIFQVFLTWEEIAVCLLGGIASYCFLVLLLWSHRSKKKEKQKSFPHDETLLNLSELSLLYNLFFQTGLHESAEAIHNEIKKKSQTIFINEDDEDED